MIVSKGLAGPCEICLYMPIRKGFADGLATRSYESRLRSFTKLFSDLRVIARESRLSRVYSDIVDRIETIHGVTISIMNDHVLLTVHFDRPWEPYIHIVWRELGFLFDAILSNCEGYIGHHDHELGSDAFAGWIRKHQVNTDTFYMNTGHTVKDVIYLDQLERRVRERDSVDHADLATFRPLNPAEQAADIRATGLYTGDTIRLGVQAIYAFHALTGLYPKDSPDHAYLLNAARSVLKDEFPATETWPDIDEVNTLKRLFAVELDWFEHFQVNDRVVPDVPRPAFDARIVQAGILTSYGDNQGLLALIQIDCPASARTFLTGLEPHISRGLEPKGDVHVNVAFTAGGLARIGLPKDTLEQFPRPFLEGMAGRAGLIGDVQHNHPDHWRLPARNWVDHAIVRDRTEIQRVNLESIDMVLQLRRTAARPDPEVAPDDPLLEKLRTLEALGSGAIKVVSVEEMYSRQIDGATKEHFGFTDGLSQPQPLAAETAFDHVPIGDVLLGHPRGASSPTAAYWSSRLFKDGTFQVVRKMHQNVAELGAAVQTALTVEGIAPEPDEIEHVLALMMGRDKSGRPVVDPERDPQDNAFDYEDDRAGLLCPHFAHIRRTNPRPEDRKQRDISAGEITPRLLRRGMSFGPGYDPDVPESANAERGLIFQAYNTDLSEQFETIQRWVAGANRTAPYGKLSDPFLGVPRQHEPRVFRLPDGKKLDLGTTPFVTLDWGAYLFAPSIEGLLEIAETVPEPDRDWDSDGAAIIKELKALEQVNLETARAGWKRLLEEKESRDAEDHRATWSAIRNCHGGALRTPFGVLVATRELIDRVLSDSEHFSVSAYNDRLKLGIGGNYLGYDEPQHGASADQPNEIFTSLTESQGFETGFAAGSGLLAQLNMGGLVSLPLPKYVDFGLGTVAKLIFGIPDDEIIRLGLEPAWDAEHFEATGESRVQETVHCPYHFISTSRAVFQPAPSEYVMGVAEQQGKLLGAAVKRYTDSLTDTSITDLQKRIRDASREGEFSEVLLGALLGFMPTAQGNFLDTCREWLRSGDFWRVQNDYLKARQGQGPQDAARSAIYPALARTMAKRPVPSLIHRTAKQATQLGPLSIEPGDSLVLGLVSATAEADFADVDPVFGGNYYADVKPIHACPGKRLAMGSLQGLLAALFEVEGTLRGAPSPLALQFNKAPLQ